MNNLLAFVKVGDSGDNAAHHFELERRHSGREKRDRSSVASDAPFNPVRERSRAERQRDVEEVIVMGCCKAPHNIWMVVADRKKIFLPLANVKSAAKEDTLHGDRPPLELALEDHRSCASLSKLFFRSNLDASNNCFGAASSSIVCVAGGGSEAASVAVFFFFSCCGGLASVVGVGSLRLSESGEEEGFFCCAGFFGSLTCFFWGFCFDFCFCGLLGAFVAGAGAEGWVAGLEAVGADVGSKSGAGDGVGACEEGAVGSSSEWTIGCCAAC